MRLAFPTKTQPLHVFFDRAHVFVGFFFRVGVVKTQITHTIVDVSQTKIQTNAFGVTNVQIAIRLRRKTRVDLRVFAAGQIIFDDGADKVVIRKLFFIHKLGVSIEA